MARSMAEPRFFCHAGERLMVTRLFGQANEHEAKAARTRSLASRHVASAPPTTVVHGSPSWTCTSIVMGSASTPKRLAVGTQACTRHNSSREQERSAPTHGAMARGAATLRRPYQAV